MSDGLSQSALRTALVCAALAAVVVMAGLFSDAVRYGCLGVIVLATVVTAGERSRQGGGWWTILGIGAALSAIGATRQAVLRLSEELQRQCTHLSGRIVAEFPAHQSADLPKFLLNAGAWRGLTWPQIRRPPDRNYTPFRRSRRGIPAMLRPALPVEAGTGRG